MEFIRTIPIQDLPEGSSKVIALGKQKVVLFHHHGIISALGNACLHKGGPLGLGKVEKKYDGIYVTCPWHGWEYNIETGSAPPGYHDQAAVYDVKVEDNYILISQKPVKPSKKAQHEIPALEDLKKLQYQTHTQSINILGISTTSLNPNLPRFSTSETALEKALLYASEKYQAQCHLIKLRDLEFRHCEGYYSLHMHACTWPCSITEMDPSDGMTDIYRKLVLWADIVLLATPIRWGNPSSLYFKMAERLNCVQNQITLFDKILIKEKVASFLITGGQDNIQQVAGQMMVFFTDLGFTFPPFSFMGWSRGWTAEDMDKNIMQFKKSNYIDRSVKEIVDNCVETLRALKATPAQSLKAPKPHKQDSLTADLENPEMNM